MKLDNLKFADVQKAATANGAAKKANKDAMAKLGEAHKRAAAAEHEVEAESSELETTDEEN
jgi:hypothetical protein